MSYLYKYPLPPQNYIGEELLLGIILMYPSTLPHIIPFIQSEYFFLECHQIIYNHLIKIYTTHDLSTIEIFYYLSDTKLLKHIGGTNKIVDLMKQGQIFLSSNKINIYIQELVEIINFNYIKRLIIQYGQNIIQLAYIKQISTYQLYNKASSYLHLTEKKIPKNYIKTFEKLISHFLLSFKTSNFTTKHLTHVKNINYQKSGLSSLDNIISGLPDGELIVIAGRPSMGKTSLAINLMCNILKSTKSGICFFSLEMSSEQIINKLIAIYTDISIQDFQFHLLNKNKWNKINQVCRQLLKNYIYVNDISNVSIDYIEYTSKLLKKEYNTISLIIIDYLQLIQTDSKFSNQRVQELSYITRKLKLLAQYLNLPVIILSQLNRNIEIRNTKIPLLSDLRESGCINNKDKIYLNINNSILIKKFIQSQYNSILNLQLFVFIFLYNHRSSIIHNFNKTKALFYVQYIFQLKLYKYNQLSITYNHQYILYKKWLYNHFSIDNFNLLKITKLNYNEICFINKISYKKYNITYDLNIIKNFSFISQKIILHNSIEQDADIIMILYEVQNISNQLEDKKVIDISIAKNRNGKTGLCKLNFYPDKNLFIDN